ncbi:MAG: BREX-2 system adenine-specific DNA-methyltransferase PglX, partial [Verrucomicrobiota bacterium]
VLATVFVRFLEDNALVESCALAGPDRAGLRRAWDTHELFFKQNPHSTEREYLLRIFEDTSKLPGMAALFDRRHNPLWTLAPTGDAAKALIDFWRRENPETGHPLHDFSDPDWNTRFLGDLYQDLSAMARKRFALLQTPDFVEEFILDRTLTPAIETFGFRTVRMIDPTCGSGHFLLGGFSRLHRLWLEAEPGSVPAKLAQNALDQVFGVDLNPNVVAIARFRLLLAALRVSGTPQLRHAPDFKIHVTAGDSLLHGARFDSEGNPYFTERQTMFEREAEEFRDELKHHYEVEDTEALHRILGQQYHAVVGNPPYITVKDAAVSKLYRDRYPSCHRKYSLSVPFMERFFDLAVKGDGTPQQSAGFVGQITANSFMKREFGKKLIEEYLPRWDLTHVIDTAGAYIPGHGTPTVILFGKNQAPVSGAIRTVLGIRGEPATPGDPSQGLVWQAITHQIDQSCSVSEWVSASDSPRAKFHKHPWSIGGGGVAELKEELDEVGENTLADVIELAGFGCVIGEDEVFTAPLRSSHFRRLPADLLRPLSEGDVVRDWRLEVESEAIFPYDAAIELRSDPCLLNWLWPLRSQLKARKDFGQKSYADAGRPYWEYHQIPIERNKAKLLIVFAEVASHNHFVLSRSAKVFAQTAPIMKLPDGATEQDYLTLVGYLNSSAFCFLMKQVAQQKQMTGGDGVRVETRAKVPYQFASTQLLKLVIPDAFFSGALRMRLTDLTVRMDALATELESLTAEQIVQNVAEAGVNFRTKWESATTRRRAIRSQLIILQEQIDFTVYQMFGIADASLQGDEIDEVLFGAAAGSRPFEIIAGQNIDGFPSRTDIPDDWPEVARGVWTRRIAAIRESKTLELIEDPHYKRRWIGRQGVFNHTRRSDEIEVAARDWLLARLEGYFFERNRVCPISDGFASAETGFTPAKQPAFTTTHELAGIAQMDPLFMVVGEQLKGGPGYSVHGLVGELVETASVPFLPGQRYKASGLLKRADWETVWDLQRREDAIDAELGVDAQGLSDAEATSRKQAAAIRKKAQVGDIPVPPKYGSGDFKRAVYWSLRGKLDVPKERWVLYPGVERNEDPSPVIAWAGWDHAQQAQALASYYMEARHTWAFPPQKLRLLLAGLLELLPWLHQWHSAVDPTYGASPAESIEALLDAECHDLGLTRVDLNTTRMTESAAPKERKPRAASGSKKAAKSNLGLPEPRNLGWKGLSEDEFKAQARLTSTEGSNAVHSEES